MGGHSVIRTSKNGFGAVRTAIACGLMAMGCEATEESTGTNHIQTSSKTHVEGMTNAPVAEQTVGNHSIFDTVQGSASSRIVSLAQWVDSFFDDPEYNEDEADARASFKQIVTFYRNLDPVYRTVIRGTVTLPNLSRKLRLTFEGNDDLASEDEVGAAEESLADSTRGSVDDPSFRLQYLFLKKPDIDFGMSGGVRLNEPDLYTGPLLKLRAGIGAGWHTKFIQRLYWYTSDNLRTKTELRFDHLVGERNLFRQDFRTDWDEETYEHEGFRNTLTSSITQPLPHHAALRYAWSSVYLTQPDSRWRSTTLSIGYRRGLWREWVILEIAPFVRWEERYDWDPSPGIALSLNAIFDQK